MLYSLAIAGAAAIFVFIATTAVVRLTRQENAHSAEELDRYKADTGNVIAAANEKAAQSNERAAALEAKAAELRLEVERIRNPRAIPPGQYSTIIPKLSLWSILPGTNVKQSVAVFPVNASHESASLANQLAAILGQQGANWDVNRHPVAYGMTFTGRGVGILTSSNPRGVAVAEALIEALNSSGIETTMVPTKRSGCEEQAMEQEKIDATAWCSSISVMVGDKP